jgi:hypothetical protein
MTVISTSISGLASGLLSPVSALGLMLRSLRIWPFSVPGGIVSEASAPYGLGKADRERDRLGLAEDALPAPFHLGHEVRDQLFAIRVP